MVGVKQCCIWWFTCECVCVYMCMSVYVCVCMYVCLLVRVAVHVAVQDFLQRDLDPDAFRISCGLLPSH